MPTKTLFLFSALLLSMLNAVAIADTVTLNSGEKIDGKITAETATDITIDVKVSAGISDTRTISKKDVLKVDKEQPDAVAWQQLKNLKLGTNSLPTASYDQIIKALQTFSTQYPASAHASEAQKLIAEFTAEKKRVATGEIKLGDKWLSKEEVEKERYQISAMLAFNFMRDQSTRGDLVGALNTFDAIEVQYPGAKVYPDAVELARRILPSLKQDVDRRLPLLTQEIEQRRKAINAAVEPQRTELMTTQQREQAAADAALAASDRQRLKWPPVTVRSERSLASLQSLIPSEQQRLNQVDVAKLRQSMKLVEKARESFAKKDFDAAETTLRQASDLWYTNEVATRLQAEIAQARNGAAAAPAEPVADPAVSPPPAASATTTAAPPASAATASSAPARSVTSATTQTSPTAAVAVPADVPAITADTGDSQAEPEKPFLLRPIGAITVILLVVAVVAAVKVYKKIKSRSSDVLE